MGNTGTNTGHKPNTFTGCTFIQGVFWFFLHTVLSNLDPPLPPLSEPVATHLPHFRIPLTDRFNYVSLDCSAASACIHTSHPDPPLSSFPLSSKKDRYMLSPCSTKPNFVVVQPCDDIQINTVQLANIKFFPGCGLSPPGVSGALDIRRCCEGDTETRPLIYSLRQGQAKQM